MTSKEQSFYRIMFADYGDILSLNDVAKILKVSTAKATQMLNDKEIKSWKIGQQYRIPKLALVEYVLRSSDYTDLDFEKWINKEVCKMLGIEEEDLKFKLN